MTHSPAEIIKQLLIDLEHGVEVPEVKTTKPDWAIYTNYYPDSDKESDNILCIYDTAGLIDGRDHRNKQSIEHPGWQVRVRAKNFSTGWSKIDTVKRALEQVARREVTIDEQTYVVAGIHRTGTPIPLNASENDRKRREAFTLNGICTIT